MPSRPNRVSTPSNRAAGRLGAASRTSSVWSRRPPLTVTVSSASSACTRHSMLNADEVAAFLDKRDMASRDALS